MVYKINPNACIGCHACMGVCPVMAITDDAGNPGKCKIVPEKCISCGTCAAVCPVMAIAVDVPAPAAPAAPTAK